MDRNSSRARGPGPSEEMERGPGVGCIVMEGSRVQTHMTAVPQGAVEVVTSGGTLGDPVCSSENHPASWTLPALMAGLCLHHNRCKTVIDSFPVTINSERSKGYRRAEGSTADTVGSEQSHWQNVHGHARERKSSSADRREKGHEGV
ncbi:hypothetical protein DPEC_G00022330 [Dallia pectoralis]|uniref:Uncharacterized protein n=1 Tax=Dallia pectoralis TaxID=75939 RepID=A0ACC2HH41_DALPE|nr:hypothetical protein DPEC_G00022330 [Dallia pectoralis]